MDKKIFDHYLQFSVFTNPGCYAEFLRTLPDEISELGNLICHQIIHRTILEKGNTGVNADERYGDMTKFPWHRLRCDDDVLMTATSMIAELLRLDSRGFERSRAVENKIVVTCRYVSVLMSSILKTKGIPTRSRSGFAPYISTKTSNDHWINQYWSKKKNRWVAFDADGLFENLGFDQFDIPKKEFDWAAEVWLDIRQHKNDGKRFVYADGKGTSGLEAVIRSVFYDFHALMNNEISYKFQPSYIDEKFNSLTKNDFKEIDQLAELLLNPDKNFDKIVRIWNSKKRFRKLNSPLVG